MCDLKPCLTAMKSIQIIRLTLLLRIVYYFVRRSADEYVLKVFNQVNIARQSYSSIWGFCTYVN